MATRLVIPDDLARAAAAEGREDWLAVLPHTDLHATQHVFNGVRHAVETLPFPVARSCRILVRWDRQLIPSAGRSIPPRTAADGHAVRG